MPKKLNRLENVPASSLPMDISVQPLNPRGLLEPICAEKSTIPMFPPVIPASGSVEVALEEPTTLRFTPVVSDSDLVELPETLTTPMLEGATPVLTGATVRLPLSFKPVVASDEFVARPVTSPVPNLSGATLVLTGVPHVMQRLSGSIIFKPLKIESEMDEPPTCNRRRRMPEDSKGKRAKHMRTWRDVESELQLLTVGEVVKKLESVFPSPQEVKPIIERTCSNTSVLARCYTAESVASPIDDGRETLWLHQAHSVTTIIESLSRVNGFILGDNVGAGKTDQALALAAHMIGSGFIKRIVVLLPEAVLTDWQEALQRYPKTFPAAPTVIKRGSELSTMSLELPAVILIKHNIKPSGSKADACLRRLIVDPEALILADEAPGAEGVIKYVYAQTPYPFKIPISGTIVASSVTDIALLLANVLGVPDRFILAWVHDVNNLLNVSLPNKPSFRSRPDFAKEYLSLLNLVSAVACNVAIRGAEQLLELGVPDYTVQFTPIDAGTGSVIRARLRSEPRHAFSTIGTTAHLTSQLAAQYRASINPHDEAVRSVWLPKLDEALKRGSVLLVVKSQKEAAALRKMFVNLNETGSTYHVVAPKSKRQREKAKSADINTIFITELSSVAGFNIQEVGAGLNSVFFLTALRHADDFRQAIGRAVRPRERKLAGKVHVEFYLPHACIPVQQQMLNTTANAKALVTSMAAAPGVVAEWLIVNRVLSLDSAKKLSLSQVVKEKQDALTGLSNSLSAYLQEDNLDNWLNDDNPMLIYLFMHTPLDQLSNDDIKSQMLIIGKLRTDFVEKFNALLPNANLSQLTHVNCWRLVKYLNCHREYGDSLFSNINDSAVIERDAFKALLVLLSQPSFRISMQGILLSLLGKLRVAIAHADLEAELLNGPVVRWVYQQEAGSLRDLTELRFRKFISTPDSLKNSSEVKSFIAELHAIREPETFDRDMRLLIDAQLSHKPFNRQIFVGLLYALAQYNLGLVEQYIAHVLTHYKSLGLHVEFSQLAINYPDGNYVALINMLTSMFDPLSSSKDLNIPFQIRTVAEQVRDGTVLSGNNLFIQAVFAAFTQKMQSHSVRPPAHDTPPAAATSMPPLPSHLPGFGPVAVMASVPGWVPVPSYLPGLGFVVPGAVMASVPPAPVPLGPMHGRPVDFRLLGRPTATDPSAGPSIAELDRVFARKPGSKGGLLPALVDAPGASEWLELEDEGDKSDSGDKPGSRR